HSFNLEEPLFEALQYLHHIPRLNDPLGFECSPETQLQLQKIRSIFDNSCDLREQIFTHMVDNAEFLQEMIVWAAADLYDDPAMPNVGAEVKAKVEVGEEDADLDGVLEACPKELREYVQPVLAKFFFLGYYSRAVIESGAKAEVAPTPNPVIEDKEVAS